MDLPAERNAPCIAGECGFIQFFSDEELDRHDPKDCWRILYLINRTDPSVGYDICPIADAKARDVALNAETDGEFYNPLQA